MGVIGLLATCSKVALPLKTFHDVVAVVDVKVKGLLTEVESFTQALKLMEDTLKQDEVQQSFQTTGHISNHWSNLSTTITHCHNTLLGLEETLTKINKTVRVLTRVQSAADEIAIDQLQIHSPFITAPRRVLFSK